MLTAVEGQGTTARNSWYDPGALTAGDYSAKYVSDTNGSGIRINGEGLLTNKLTCEDSYCLVNTYDWQEPKITLDEDFANKIAAEVAKKLIKQKDPLEKNSDVDEVEVPPMSGFIEI